MESIESKLSSLSLCETQATNPSSLHHPSTIHTSNVSNNSNEQSPSSTTTTTEKPNPSSTRNKNDIIDEMQFQTNEAHEDISFPQQGFSEAMRKAISKNHFALKRSKNEEPLEFLFVIDFECNQPGCEIIEFPIIVVDLMRREICEEFHTYVRPTIVPTIPGFISGLTGIKQDLVSSCEDIKSVLLRVEDFLEKYSSRKCSILYDCSNDAKFLGDEIRNKRIEFKNANRPPELLLNYINLRNVFPIEFTGGIPNSSLKHALEVLELDFQGNRHTGRDDARNIARVCIELARRDFVFSTFMRQSMFCKDMPRVFVNPQLADQFAMSKYLILIDMQSQLATTATQVEEEPQQSTTTTTRFNKQIQNAKKACINVAISVYLMTNPDREKEESDSEFPELKKSVLVDRTRDQKPQREQPHISQVFQHLGTHEFQPKVEQAKLPKLLAELNEFFNRFTLKSSNAVMVLNANQKIQVFRQVIKQITQSSKDYKQRFMFKKKLFSFASLASSEMPTKQYTEEFPANVLSLVNDIREKVFVAGGTNSFKQNKTHSNNNVFQEVNGNQPEKRTKVNKQFEAAKLDQEERLKTYVEKMEADKLKSKNQRKRDNLKEAEQKYGKNYMKNAFEEQLKHGLRIQQEQQNIIIQNQEIYMMQQIAAIQTQFPIGPIQEEQIAILMQQHQAFLFYLQQQMQLYEAQSQEMLIQNNQRKQHKGRKNYQQQQKQQGQQQPQQQEQQQPQQNQEQQAQQTNKLQTKKLRNQKRTQGNGEQKQQTQVDSTNQNS